MNDDFPCARNFAGAIEVGMLREVFGDMYNLLM